MVRTIARKRAAIAAVLSLIFAFAPSFAQDEGAGSGDDLDRPRIFFNQNPRIVAYQLGRLSNERLLLVERRPDDVKYVPVYRAILARAGMSDELRREALRALISLNDSNAVAELAEAIGRVEPSEEMGGAVLHELGRLLLTQPKAELSEEAETLRDLAAGSDAPLAREIGYAALLTCDDARAVWEFAAEQEAGLESLLGSFSMLADRAVLAPLYSNVENILEQADAPLARAAMEAIGRIPGHGRETFARLADRLLNNSERDAAVRALLLVPRGDWPAKGDASVSELARAAAAFAAAEPLEKRSSAAFSELVQLGNALAQLMPEDEGEAIQRELSALGVRVERIGTIRHQMLYDRSLIVVEAGEPVEIVFQNSDIMPHNLVVVAPGAVEEIGMAAEQMPPTPDARGFLYVPDSPKVLHATRLLQAGEETRLSFVAPTEPGDYPYVCTFPGHWRRMVGTLAVVNDVEAYLAQLDATEAPQVREWTAAEFAEELDEAHGSRNLAGGEDLFTTLACAQCHRLGAQGYAYGPDLTGTFEKWNGDGTEVLRQILEPSLTIEERYQNVEFTLKDGTSVTGMVIEEDGNTLLVQTGPSDALIQEIPKAQVKSRRAQPTSVMPMGLLSLANKEQILDLLAFIRSGGVSDAEAESASPSRRPEPAAGAFE